MSDKTTTTTNDTDDDVNDEVEVAAPAPTDRDGMRALIFGAKPKGELIEFFGTTLELRDPPTSVVLDAQNETDKKAAMMNLIIRYSYLPGTNTQVFEESDTDSLLALPFGKDMMKMNSTIQKLMGIEVTPATKSVAAE